MKKLKGKCKTCIGCNLSKEFGFKGKKYCKYYISKRNYKLIIAEFVVICLLISLGFVIYEKINMLCGG